MAAFGKTGFGSDDVCTQCMRPRKFCVCTKDTLVIYGDPVWCGECPEPTTHTDQEVRVASNWVGWVDHVGDEHVQYVCDGCVPVVRVWIDACGPVELVVLPMRFTQGAVA